MGGHREHSATDKNCIPERVSKLDKPGKVEKFASTGEERRVMLISSVLPGRSPSNSLRIPTPNFSFSSDSSMENRHSSTGLLSPPIDSPQIDQEQGNFYLLKKDSQRQATICKVLLDNAEIVVHFDVLKTELLFSRHSKKS
ncbi:mitogen-activated protein kinase kinase kinase 5 [Trichonephila clavipes]|nr:mitogen-activated protein kinase kinase kinase 5 [Trichonephila clavipes]